MNQFYKNKETGVIVKASGITFYDSNYEVGFCECFRFPERLRMLIKEKDFENFEPVDKETNIYLNLLYFYGESQVTQTIQECGELIQALTKYQLGQENRENILEELVDVTITTQQMFLKFGFTEEEIEKEKEFKLKRTIKRTEEKEICKKDKND